MTQSYEIKINSQRGVGALSYFNFLDLIFLSHNLFYSVNINNFSIRICFFYLINYRLLYL